MKFQGKNQESQYRRWKTKCNPEKVFYMLVNSLMCMKRWSSNSWMTSRNNVLLFLSYTVLLGQIFIKPSWLLSCHCSSYDYKLTFITNFPIFLSYVYLLSSSRSTLLILPLTLLALCFTHTHTKAHTHILQIVISVEPFTLKQVPKIWPKNLYCLPV